MTNTIILDNFLPGTLAQQCLNAITDLQSTHPQSFSRYDNPWEHKTILNKKLPPTPSNKVYNKDDCPPAYPYTIQEAVIATCLERMRRGRKYFADCLQPDPPYYHWEVDTSYHYDGVFVYHHPGDRLAMHLDAGIHPTNGLRKHATAVLFLTHSKAPLVLQTEVPKPVWKYGVQEGHMTAISVVPNRLVCFVNDDNAWHGVSDLGSDEQRVALTVSFMSSAVDLYSNKRTRAYFADTGDPVTDAMRDERSQEGHDLYRVASPKELP